eukprot:CAMPEP_0204588060 /NCGR_PEP_ID=MMETSP0661-20131031/48407_1 /ASSEMBLY_ACC=CAM_ASM_000606 /TAXON_ID=109239 /ORGANISM="Alexandrium margalefi, Strain AMGDE01CS-322" /LENGTH=49 /DNA_ID= /DNA_START= /DNA_END= /DNA_ORIENTATION=
MGRHATENGRDAEGASRNEPGELQADPRRARKTLITLVGVKCMQASLQE